MSATTRDSESTMYTSFCKDNTPQEILFFFCLFCFVLKAEEPTSLVRRCTKSGKKQKGAGHRMRIKKKKTGLLYLYTKEDEGREILRKGCLLHDEVVPVTRSEAVAWFVCAMHRFFRGE